MKTIRRTIAAGFAAILLLGPALTSCQKEPVERTTVEQQEDEKLAETVKASFASSASFKFPDVQVAAFKGTVQLSGFVISDDQREAAQEIARNVAGVKDVENKISVKR
ncbi:MAG: BON domain-containing protein [Verrucomicrobiota bacterium]|nr:BON domain-containing protein [Verrucomicrobiota bacterium]